MITIENICMRVFHSVVIHEKPASKRRHIRSKFNPFNAQNAMRDTLAEQKEIKAAECVITSV